MALSQTHKTDFRILDRPDVPIRKIAAGTRIVVEGGVASEMYLLRKGKVEIHLHGKAIEEVGPGGIFGEMALIDQGTRGATAIALEDSDVIPINEKLFAYGDATRVVPGHGPASNDWPAAMDAQAGYLNGLLRDTRAAIRNRLTIQQAVDTVPIPVPIAPTPPWRLTDRFHRRNVTAAYAELEWEDDAPSPVLPAPTPGSSASSARPGGD